jgi:hypothetical protein
LAVSLPIAPLSGAAPYCTCATTGFCGVDTGVNKGSFGTIVVKGAAGKIADGIKGAGTTDPSAVQRGVLDTAGQLVCAAAKLTVLVRVLPSLQLAVNVDAPPVTGTVVDVVLEPPPQALRMVAIATSAVAIFDERIQRKFRG